MDAIVEIAKKKRILASNEEITRDNFTSVWNQTFNIYLSYLYDEDTLKKPSFRRDEIYYTTLHNRHTKKEADGQTCYARSLLLDTSGIIRSILHYNYK